MLSSNHSQATLLLNTWLENLSTACGYNERRQPNGRNKYQCRIHVAAGKWFQIILIYHVFLPKELKAQSLVWLPYIAMMVLPFFETYRHFETAGKTTLSIPFCTNDCCIGIGHRSKLIKSKSDQYDEKM